MSSIEINTMYHVYVDSNNRISGNSSNFYYSIDLPDTVKYDKVVLLNASIPKSYYLIQDAYNSFILKELNDTKTIYIPIGNYGFNQWISTITSLLNSNSPNGWMYTLSYSSISDTGKIKYLCNNDAKFIFSNNNSVAEQFGFDLGSTNSFTMGVLHSKNIIKLQAEDRLYITSNIISTGNKLKILQEINSSSNASFSTIVYQCTSPEYYSKYLISDHSGSFNFALIDIHGQNIDLNGLPMSFTLMFYKENDIFYRLKNFLRVILMKLGL